ncbi:Clp protease N-terminal domain-containing protein [Actinomadura livida]|uniref:Clp R domain-containing protein n=1 Tax=Actinomadura livida TaxID=79909 RepID=A0A7W7IJQ6_9ACTN|nr:MULTISPECIES: Clp protease N-terminal domain-containing protein [Actinomadura]MBB4778245.1 hypothetical protein [Actinomadura catellatispora]GGU40035.1 hypothetical protein GCM10010208_75190 [Actinomadura livida]
MPMVEPVSGLFRVLLYRAYRRACRAGVDEVGTELVLDSAAISVTTSDGRPLLRPLVDNVGWRGETAQTDPPPPSTEWESVFGREVAYQAAVLLGEVASSGGLDLRRKGRAVPVFSPAVRYAVHDAIASAADEEHGYAELHHLVTALLKLPGPAAESLTHWVPEEDLQRIELGQDLRREDNRQTSWTVGVLQLSGQVPGSGSRASRWFWRTAAWWFVRQFQRPFRRYGARYGHPLLSSIEGDAVSKALQTGHGVVTAAHVLLSVIDLYWQLDQADTQLRDKVARWNQAGLILAAHGIRPGPDAWAAAVRLEPTPDDAEHDLTGLPTEGWPPLPSAPVSEPVPGRTALSALRLASLSAHRLGHPFAGTTHLLAELLADPAGPAARLLRELGADPAVLHSEAVQRLEAAAPGTSGDQS